MLASLHGKGKVLVSAFNNVAVDELAMRAIKMGLQIVRIGNPVRSDPELQAMSLSQLESVAGESLKQQFDTAHQAHKANQNALRNCDDTIRKAKHALRKCEQRLLDFKQMEKKCVNKKRNKRGNKKNSTEQSISPQSKLDQLRSELKKLRTQYTQFAAAEQHSFLKVKSFDDRFKEIRRLILNSSDAVFATCIGVSNSDLKDFAPNAVLIDECTQALEPACLVPLLKLRPSSRSMQHMVLVGDHKQLPPTVKSTYQPHEGLKQSLFERLQPLESACTFKAMLNIQYRMHPALSQFPSQYFYQNALKNGVSSRDRKLDAEHMGAFVNSLDNTSSSEPVGPLLFIDIGEKARAREIRQDDSFRNDVSAGLVSKIVSGLFDHVGIPDGDAIGIITAYGRQRRLLATHSFHSKGVEVRTIDGFQGREKDVIIFDMVRNNANGNLGFLALDERRLNVALTRAKRLLIIIGSVSTIEASSSIAWNQLVTHVRTEGGLINGNVSS